MRTMIVGTGAAIPTLIKHNSEFALNKFYDKHQRLIPEDPEVITRKFEAITGIRARRYAAEGQNASDLALEAARMALQDAGMDAESLDFILMADNFGDVTKHTIQTNYLPALACRVKHGLGITNPDCIAFDIVIGCPGWIQCFIQAELMIRSGEAKRGLVIGAETLSRVIDHSDRDSMIFSDGAGAVVLEAQDQEETRGVLASKAATYTLNEALYLFLGKSNYPESDPRIRYIKMDGRKIYEFSLMHVPQAMKAALDKSGVPIHDLKKIFIHQANEKMDEAIIERFYKLYDLPVPKNIMPMNIQDMGNSSVATIPTLYHQVLKGQISDQSVQKGDVILFASVGAGMHINALVYGV